MSFSVDDNLPENLLTIEAKSKEIGFTMPSDRHVGALLRSLIASKPKARVLELGTGASLSLTWMVDGLGQDGSLISIDNDPELISLAHAFFGEDSRVQLICDNGTTWLKEYNGLSFDLIFADAWPGKYSELEEALALLEPGGFYVIDDMKEQPNWPTGHAAKAAGLIQQLESRNDLLISQMDWSTGVVLATKK
jgi:predicted O-methyltransferase YrrM